MIDIRKKIITCIIGAAWLVVLTLLIYFTGGTKNAYVHLLYLPIIFMAIKFGQLGGAVTGLIAGLLMAFMPLDTATGQMQPLMSALTRMALFVLMGGYAGWMVTRMEREQGEVRRLLEESVLALVNTIDSSHSWTSGHSLRVTAIALLLGEKLRLNETDMYILRAGSLLHDIGKIAIPQKILDKRGPLTPDERRLIEMHPVEGEQILHAFHHPRADAIRDIIRHHHERLDGSGYPDGLRGEQISLFARIVAVADVYEAMTSARPYRRAMSPVQALSIMEREAEMGKLDATLFSHLRELVLAGRVPESNATIDEKQIATG